MRTAGIIRIIIGLVIAVLLTAILVVLLTGNNIFSRLGWDGSWVNNIVDRATYSSGGVDLDSDEIVVSQEAKVPASTVQIDQHNVRAFFTKALHNRCPNPMRATGYNGNLVFEPFHKISF